MSSNAHLNIARGFQRTDPSLLGGHPLRGTLKDRIQREHLLRNQPADLRGEKIAKIRDAIISIMGIVSALIPMMVAFQSVMGA